MDSLSMEMTILHWKISTILVEFLLTKFAVGEQDPVDVHFVI